MKTFLAENMITMQTHWTDEGAVADGTHEMVVVVGYVVQTTKVDEFIVLVKIRQV